MSDKTAIEWTDATWNPITGCSVVSPGCTNCYAMKLAGGRLQHHPSRAGLTNPSRAGPVWNGEVRFNGDQMKLPLNWTRPRRIFVCAHGDLFHEAVPDEWIDRVFAVMALCPQHTFQVLTKRASRMRAYLTDASLGRRLAIWLPHINLQRGLHGLPSLETITAAGLALRTPLPNVWLGVSAEDQARLDERVTELMATPAAVRFVSAEPLLGSINMQWALSPNRLEIAGGFQRRGRFSPGLETLRPLDWVIVGGESGPGARPMHPDWARQIRDDCAAAGVAFHFKQWGEWAPGEACPNLNARDAATWFTTGWTFERVPAGAGDGHIDDEPDVYRIGKKAAGRLLDGLTHDGFPGVAS